ncbi:MAG: N-acetylmuramoyl-L-alanine amidase-like domain-containing protein, partial [Gammaproteobacteria bacterium]
MKIKYNLILLFIAILVTVATGANADNGDEIRKDQATIIEGYSYAAYDKAITTIYDEIPEAKSRDFPTKIATLSEYFLETEYVLGPLGEGESGQFDQRPLYRTDAFDCVTYVETIIALANSYDLEEFKQHMLNIRYENDEPSFLSRNHFTSVDWNKSNNNKGYINDITYKFTDESGAPVAINASTIINKPGWYQHFKANRLELLKSVTKEETEQLLDELRNLANDVQQEQGAML